MSVPTNWRERAKRSLDEYERLPNRFGHTYDDVFNHLVWTETEPAASMLDFENWLGGLGSTWAFRGQREVSWPLQTSLDRQARTACSIGQYRLDCRAEEKELLFRFQQQAHNYISDCPPDDDRVSWLALMQHYGVPTRLLDWTWSPYVALYFAVEERPQGNQSSRYGRNIRGGVTHELHSAVWAIDMDWLEGKAQDQIGPIPKDPSPRAEYLNDLLDKRQQPLIVRVDPSIAGERMQAQRGFFLWKLFEHARSFDHILITMMRKPELPLQPVIRKLQVRETSRIVFLEALRERNIHRGRLFPGIDGFCQSLRAGLEIKIERERHFANGLRRGGVRA